MYDDIGTSKALIQAKAKTGNTSEGKAGIKLHAETCPKSDSQLEILLNPPTHTSSHFILAALGLGRSTLALFTSLPT
jgi:hypothetical protein